MEEDEYRSAYRTINERRCVFEKAITHRHAECARMARFLLAEREGVGCHSAAGCQRCTRFLESLRRNARFTLGLIATDGPLPHNKEIRIQVGGLWGLSALSDETGETRKVVDIDGLLASAEARWGGLEKLPYGDIVKDIARFKPRRWRKR